ncbi:MFS transporter [Amycolatopsis jejuensis]|uniref:MFS transporter n=1 Tax=Amycolatopsis jejuensis TaxID=330084 RepID=UPI000524D753|nr:MFS transporter [Amycolatopsis jejuensis]
MKVRQHARLVVPLCVFLVLLDGFDATALSLAVPALAADWGVDASAFTAPLVATSVGVFLGYLGSGRLARQFGKRRLLIGSTALFAVGTLVLAMVLPMQSMEAVSAIRFVTGLGFGGVLPSAVALATDFSSAERRAVVPLLVALGFSGGATVVGFAYQKIVALSGVTGLFWSVGAVSLAMVVPLQLLLPPEPAVTREPASERVRKLFGDVRADTILLWLFAFLVFAVSTALSTWAPVLVTHLGVAGSDAPLALAFIYLGAIAGAIAVIPVTAWAGVSRTLVAIPLLSAVCLLAAVTLDLRGTALVIALVGIGAGISASQSGQLSLAVALYPREHRTTGIGWSSAMGRAGSVAGPAATGILLGVGTPAPTILALAAAATFVAVGCAVVMWLRTRTLVGSAG